jgi:hypothetical protein
MKLNGILRESNLVVLGWSCLQSKSRHGKQCFVYTALSRFALITIIWSPEYFMIKTVHATTLTKQIASLVFSRQVAYLENTKFPDPHSLVELNYYIINVN